MIEHFHRSIRDELTIQPEDVQHVTRKVIDPDAGDRAIQHFLAIMANQYGSNAAKTAAGLFWEACVHDAVMAHAADHGVTLDVRFNVDIVAGKHAEVDLVYSREGFEAHVLCKTSLRERWKQLDRDALVASMAAQVGAGRAPDAVFGVFIHENVSAVVKGGWPISDATRAQALKKAAGAEACCFSNTLSIVTAIDPTSMQKMLDQIIGV